MNPHHRRLTGLAILVAACSFLLLAPSVEATTDEYAIVIDIVDYDPIGECDCDSLTSSPTAPCPVSANTEDNNVGYYGQDGSAEDGWEIALVAKYDGAIGRQYRTAYVHADGSTTPDSNGDLIIDTYAPLDNSDFTCTNDYYDRYAVQWSIEDTIMVSGRTYTLSQMKYEVSDLDDAYQQQSGQACADREICSCVDCGVKDIFTASTPFTQTVHVVLEEPSP